MSRNLNIASMSSDAIAADLSRPHEAFRPTAEAVARDAFRAEAARLDGLGRTIGAEMVDKFFADQMSQPPLQVEQ